MKASDLKAAMMEIGFHDKVIQTLHLVDAKKAFIIAVNELVPEGSEEDPGLSDLVLRVYNTIDTDAVTDWPEPQPIKSNKPSGFEQINQRQRTAKAERERIKAEAKAQKAADKAAKVEADKRPVGKPPGIKKTKTKHIADNPVTHTPLRGSAVEFSRATGVLEALRVGGTRIDIMKRADRLYMNHGGGSNLKETEMSLIHCLRVLKILKLVDLQEHPVRTYKLKKFFTADSKEYQQLNQT